MFHPGETVAFNWVIPFDSNDLEYVVVSFRDRNRVAFEKVIRNFVREDQDKTRVGLLLTQEESLLFDENSCYSMELNVYGLQTSRATSNCIKVRTLCQHIPEVGINEHQYRGDD